MNQTLEFQDGLFFNGIDGMSIRVGHQNQETGLLTDVLIYDNRNASGNMTTTVADSGYIRLSDDKRFLEITLFNGERYEQTRNSSQWYNKSSLQRNKFELQKANISISGFEMQRTDADLFNNAQTKNISELQYEIDTLTQQVNSATTRSYDPLLKERIFVRDTTVITDRNDSVVVENGISGRWMPSTPWRLSTCAPRTESGARPFQPHATPGLCSRSTNRRPKMRSTSSTAARSNGTRNWRFR